MFAVRIVSVFFDIFEEDDVDYSEAVYDFLDLLMDKVGSEHSEKRFHFIERIVNLGKGFFELSDGVLFLNIVKRVFDVEDLNADCVQQLFSLIIEHVLFLLRVFKSLWSQHRIYTFDTEQEKTAFCAIEMNL